MDNVRILLSDNDYNFGYVLKKELEEYCYQVDHVSDALSTIIHFMEKEYEFILLEVFMPKMSNIETLKIINALQKIKKINTDAKIITFSCENKKKGNEMRNFGSIKYYKKPFDIESLVSFMECQVKIQI